MRGRVYLKREKGKGKREKQLFVSRE